jgi:hypothetical protein
MPGLNDLYVIGRCAYIHPHVALSSAFYFPFTIIGPMHFHFQCSSNTIEPSSTMSCVSQTCPHRLASQVVPTLPAPSNFSRQDLHSPISPVFVTSTSYYDITNLEHSSRPVPLPIKPSRSSFIPQRRACIFDTTSPTSATFIISELSLPSPSYNATTHL